MAKDPGRVPTPPPAPAKRIAEPFTAPHTRLGSVQGPGRPYKTAHDLAMKSRGPIRPLTKGRR